MDDFLLSFMDNGDVLFMDVFLVDNGLDVLVDHRSVMLMDNILM